MNGKWYGDEVHGNSTVTDDFYKYFGGEDMKGIDVSVHNGNIDWQKVKSAGIDFAILRAGYGRLASQKDEKFEQNYAAAKAAGIPVGAYWYSYAMTPEEAELEADVFLSVIKGKQFEFPVYYDVEKKKQFDLPEEAEIVRMIFNDFLSGMGKNAIANKLLGMGAPTKGGGIWTAWSIRRILKNEKYCGDLLLQKSYRENHITKRKMPNNGELPQYYVEEGYLEIVHN